MATTERSNLYRLIEKQLGEPLEDYVATRRPRLSWRDLAQELSAHVGVDVSHESLRLWFTDISTSTATTAAVA